MSPAVSQHWLTVAEKKTKSSHREPNRILYPSRPAPLRRSSFRADVNQIGDTDGTVGKGLQLAGSVKVTIKT